MLGLACLPGTTRAQGAAFPAAKLPTMLEALEQEGHVLVRQILSVERVEELLAALATAAPPVGATCERRGSVFGVRNILGIPAVREIAASEPVCALMNPVLGDSIPVRGILFDKTPGANWCVPWHQDLSLAVAARPAEGAPGWGPWSEKAGVVHVQPPAKVLDQMLTIRLHLDSCPAENGALRVLPGTHRLGRLTPADTARLRAEIPEAICACESGDGLVMRPLLLHASAESRQPGRRRVLHIEYAPATLRLPPGISWHTAPL